MTSATSSTLWRHARTLLTAQCSVAGSMLIGDTACQYIGRNDPHLPPSTPLSPPLPSLSPLLSPHLPPFLNPDRSLTMLLTGFCVSGPWSFLVLSASERLFPGTAMRAVLSKVATNGLIAPVGISLAFTTISLLEGRGWESAKQKVQGDLGSTWLTGALYWPFVSTLNFRFVPFQWRPLFSGMAGAVWSTYMSNQAHKQPPAAAEAAVTSIGASERDTTPAPATTAIAVTAASS